MLGVQSYQVKVGSEWSWSAEVGTQPEWDGEWSPLEGMTSKLTSEKISSSKETTEVGGNSVYEDPQARKK